MSDRKKILIIERDDFLREITGNLLHKQGVYILNGFCIQNGLEGIEGQHVHHVILGTSCRDFKGKQSIDYIKKNINVDSFYLLNAGKDTLNYAPADQQMKISELSIEKLVGNFL